MWWKLAQLFYLLAPAYAANMTPPFTRFLSRWNRPINVRWFGAHKTILGAASGVAMAMIVAFVQSRVAWRGALVDYAQWPAIGLALGIGAMGGDLVKSFFKRRRGISPGARWIPADQLDFVLGALVFVAPWARLGALEITIILVVTFVADIAVNQIAFRLGIRESAW